jgi:hypothetical protein
MKGLQNKYCLIPANVLQNLDEIAELIKPEIKGFSMDCLKETVSIISVHARKDETAIPLKMTYLKQIVPQGDKYLLCLIKLSVVIRSGEYIPGIKSYMYDFADYFKSKYVSIPLTDARLIRRIGEAQNGFERQGSKSVRGYSGQVQYLKKLTIADGWEKCIEENFKDEPEKFNANMANATRIKNRDLFWTIDSTSGRFHSNVTNSSKLLRPYLRIDGKPLCNLDIKNCQPYLSIILLTNPGKVSWMTKNPAFAMLLQTLKVSANEDVKKYISLVISGQIYEYLMQEFSKEGLTLTRSETKEQMLRILFARNRMPKDETNKKCRNIFKNCFPTVHKIFSKVRGSEKGDKFTRYNRFSILLQRIESYLMLDRILKRVYKELPEVIAITIHDSIMTGVMTNNVEAVRKIMIEEMTDFVGFAPNISIEGNIKDKEGVGVSLTNTMLQPLQVSECMQYN